MNRVAISFVIPAFNEERDLPNVLKSIEDYMPADLSYEVVVADNGSTDSTVSLARKSGAYVLVDESATVARLRNIAVREAHGEVLVFLDADISLTRQWGANIFGVYQSILSDPNIITGSRCGIPSEPSWIERVWFKPLIHKPGKYINSGHMITSRALFDQLGGFNESLETGEDYAFGVSAQALDATIVNNTSLPVVHYGYPKTICQFMRREMWHGRGDCESIRSIMSSNVALASIIFVMLHLVFIVGIFLLSYILAGVASSAIIIMCVSSALYKYDAQAGKNLMLISLLYYLYYLSRFLSCISVINVSPARRV